MGIEVNDFRLTENVFIGYIAACRFDNKTVLMLKEFVVDGYTQAEVSRRNGVTPQFFNNRLKKFINIVERSVAKLPEPLKLVSFGLHPSLHDEFVQLKKKSFALAVAKNAN